MKLHQFTGKLTVDFECSKYDIHVIVCSEEKAKILRSILSSVDQKDSELE